ncbi:MAG: lipocalin family protein [Ferruginibacter sp.]
MKKILILIAFSGILFTSCKKDKTCDLNSTSLAGSYRVTSLKYKQTPTSAEVDLFSSLSACQKDDIYVYNTNGTFNYQDAGVVCSPSGSYNSTWTLSGNTLTFDGDVYNVNSFSCDGMGLTGNSIFVSGDVATATFVRL